MQKWKFYYNLHTLKLFQTCINVFQLLNTEETFWIMLVTKQLPIAIDFHSVGKKYYESQWLPSTIWVPTFF